MDLTCLYIILSQKCVQAFSLEIMAEENCVFLPNGILEEANTALFDLLMQKSNNLTRDWKKEV